MWRAIITINSQAKNGRIYRNKILITTEYVMLNFNPHKGDFIQIAGDFTVHVQTATYELGTNNYIRLGATMPKDKFEELEVIVAGGAFSGWRLQAS